MSRPIKFRVFYDKEMSEPFSITTDRATFKSGKIAHRSLFDKDFVTLMQFTGLYDKNGKEIWEGDLIRCMLDPKLISEVTFNRGSFKFDFGRTKLGDFHHADMEVLGNVYENPELLK